MADVEVLAGSTGTSTRNGAPAQLPNGIWIRNFVFDVNEDHLREMFSKFGNIVDARIVRDPRGLSRGYAAPEHAFNWLGTHG